MTSEIFYWVLNMSVSGSIAALAILLLRMVSRFPRGAVYALWSVPFLRFALPFSLGFEYSVVELLKKMNDRIVTVYPPNSVYKNFIAMSTTNYIVAATEYFPIEYRENRMRVLFEYANKVWIAVAVILMVLFAVMYILSLRDVRPATHCDGNIYVSVNVTTPTVFGVFRPKIVIPATLSGEHTDLIIMHEKVHVRRFDNLWRLVAIFVCCVHWFNPLVWILLKFFFEDMELSADAAVLKGLDEDDRREYANALVEYAERGSLFSSAFGGARLRLRVENILNYKKLTVFSVACTVLFALAIAVVFLTNSV